MAHLSDLFRRRPVVIRVTNATTGEVLQEIRVPAPTWRENVRLFLWRWLPWL
jgi:hypothetical protein